MICRVVFGSHLYGTATETSDEDWRGIFMPSREQVLLGKIPKSCRPGKEDVEYYSLHRFVELGLQGQTLAIDMLHANYGHVVLGDKYGWIWEKLVECRKLFLSKQMRAFVGYARSQAAKYSLRGDRLSRLVEFKNIISRTPGGDVPLAFFWNDVPKDAERINPQGISELQIAGKWFAKTVSVSFVRDSVDKAIASYGRRVKNAEGIDWKALSHAVRVAQELSEILAFGQIEFPLKTAPQLLRIKNGEMPLADVQALLDKELAFVELAMHQSVLPLEPDVTFWNNFLQEITHEIICDC